MKKLLCLLCIFALAIGLLAACGSKDDTKDNDDVTTTEAAPPVNDDDINAPEDFSEAFSELNGLFSAEWPENELTKQVPKPKFDTTLGGTVEGNTFSALTAATPEQLKEYVADLKKAGFDKDDATEDQNVLGMAVYTYTANNGKGYTVAVSYFAGASTITITKA